MKRTLLILVLAGCATDGGWEKQGATPEQWHMDRGACIAQMESVSFADTYQRARLFAGCMQSRGWYWVER
jgi:hypothetical protein